MEGRTSARQEEPHEDGFPCVDIFLRIANCQSRACVLWTQEKSVHKHVDARAPELDASSHRTPLRPLLRAASHLNERVELGLARQLWAAALVGGAGEGDSHEGQQQHRCEVPLSPRHLVAVVKS